MNSNLELPVWPVDLSEVTVADGMHYYRIELPDGSVYDCASHGPLNVRGYPAVIMSGTTPTILYGSNGGRNAIALVPQPA